MRLEQNELSGADAIEALAPLTQLEVLDLSTNQIGLDGVTALAAWQPAAARAAPLPVRLGDEHLIALSKAAFPLKRLDLGYGNARAPGIEAIGRTAWPLEQLELWANKIGDDGARALAGASFTRTLRGLVLGFNEIGNAGAAALAAGTWPRLERIVFRGDPIGDAGARALAASTTMPALRSLKFENMSTPKAALAPLRSAASRSRCDRSDSLLVVIPTACRLKRTSTAIERALAVLEGPGGSRSARSRPAPSRRSCRRGTGRPGMRGPPDVASCSMMARSVWVVGLALSACGKTVPAEKGSPRTASRRRSPGWALQPSKTGADLVLASPEDTQIGDKLVGDTFVVRFLPVPGSFAEFRVQVLSSMKQANIDEAMSAQNRAHPDLPKIMAEAAPVTVTDATVGGREAFQIEVRNTITIDSQPTTNIGSTYFVKFGSEVVSIALAPSRHARPRSSHSRRPSSHPSTSIAAK